MTQDTQQPDRNDRPSQADKVQTFGCRLNAFESDVIRGHLGSSGEGAAEGTRARIVFNTCAVTAEAERQARQAIRRARRENPAAEIIVTGCAAQIDPDRFSAMAEVDRVIGNEEKLRPETWHPRPDTTPAPRIAVADIMQPPALTVPAPIITGLEERVRGVVQVQGGCDHRCTFCIIPYGRGPARSVPLADVVGQARALTRAGVLEVTLSGVDLTSYGGDLPGSPTLGQMVRRLLAQVPELPRLRLSSLDPVEIDADLLGLIADEPRLTPHLHLSVQAGDDLILKRMKRRHLRRDVIDLSHHLRALRPDIVLGADLIAGFPTETEAMFENTLALVAEAGLDLLHVFPYSPRPGTPAARMPQVAGPDIRARAARLRTAGDAALARLAANRIGTHAEVLVERAGSGRTEHYLPCRLRGTAPRGGLVSVKITDFEGGTLIGDPVMRAGEAA